MPRVTVDLSEAQSRKPIPDGTYPAVVKKCEGPHKGEKSMYLTWHLSISEGEHEGRVFWHNTPITGAGAGIFADFLSKVTGNEIDVDELEKLDIDTDEIIGLPLGIVTKTTEIIRDGEPTGDMRSEIKTILKAR